MDGRQFIYGDNWRYIKNNTVNEIRDYTLTESTDFIFADPPYNMGLKNTSQLMRPDGSEVKSVDDDWDYWQTEKFIEFNRRWLTESRRVLTDDGSIAVSGSYQNIYHIGSLMIQMGFWLLNQIQFVKPNPMPQFRGVRFCHDHETIIWATKHEKSKYTFNYQLMKELNGGKQMRATWTDIKVLPNNEKVYEKELDAKGKKVRVNSAQKPEALLERIILACTNEGDTILDPFAGTFTTGKVGVMLGRNVVGIDNDPKYLPHVEERMAND